MFFSASLYGLNDWSQKKKHRVFLLDLHSLKKKTPSQYFAELKAMLSCTAFLQKL